MLLKCSRTWTSSASWHTICKYCTTRMIYLARRLMDYHRHGSWDADVKTLTKTVRGQADIREIHNDTLALWFDGLDPQKINFGMAYYGRGYTLRDPNCHDLGCSFVGASKPAPCTNYAGVMSLVEINAKIKELNLTPKLLDQAMMKQITWADQ